MFKNYLTFHFAQSFVRDCGLVKAEDGTKHELQRSAHQMLNAFSQSIKAKAGAEEGKHLFTALAHLRDCQDVLLAESIQDDRLWCHFHVLMGRLEQLFWESAEHEKNQLRMLG